MKYYFTFGFGQPHENGFHVIESNDWLKARELMIEKFGLKWAMQYDEKEWIINGKTQQELYHLHRVK